MTKAPSRGVGRRAGERSASGDGLGPGRPRRRYKPGAELARGSRNGWRFLVSMGIMTACLGGILTRLLFVQGFDSARYQQMARSEYVNKISYLGDRGAILDNSGDELAMSVPMTTVYADPYWVTNPRAEAAALSGPLGISAPVLQSELSETSGFVYLAHTIPDATAAEVEKLMRDNVLPGIYTMQEPKRFYPAGQLASPLLGMVATDGHGLSGLESKYNNLLEGKPGQLIEDVDPSGDQIPGGLEQYQAPVRGDDLVLSIDEPLQYDTENALARAIVAAQAESGMALIMDSRTGELLAVADLTMPTASDPATLSEPPALPEWFVPPSSGPNITRAQLAAAQPVEAPYASAFRNVYEPGSVQKLVTISAALASGAITPTDKFEVPGTYEVAGSSISDAWEHPTLDWTASDILAHSSDIGTIEIAQRMGMPTLLSYIHRFGMGQLTDIDFPGESLGLVPGPSKWSGTTIATMPIGQGIAVTAIQMLDAYNTIANGGMAIAPRLVDGYVDAQGTERTFPSPKPHRVVSTLVADEMTSMLEGVVRVGTGTAASLEPYTVAGKTGTALEPPYTSGFFVSSFAGFVPAEDPAITAMVVVVGTHQYGAEASAPVFAAISRDALQALGIPPHKPDPPMPGVPLATPYGGEGEAAGGPLPGLTGAPNVVAPPSSGTASTSSTTLAPLAAPATTGSTGTASTTTVTSPAGSSPSTTPAATTTTPAATTTTPAATTTTPAATTTVPEATTTVPEATTTVPAATTTTAATTATTAPPATTTVPAATTTVPAATTTVPAATTTTAPTTPAATTTAPVAATTTSAAGQQ